MKTRLYLLPIAGLLAAVLACNLSSATNATLSPADIQTLSAQTLAAIQEQTLSAEGTVLPPSGNTAIASVGPADTAANTLLPSVTPTVFVPSLTYTPTASSTPVPCNRASFISDVTIPDNWETTPNDHFTKTWRLQNAGSCTWTSGYSLVFDHGDQMGAPASQTLTSGTVDPGGTIDVSVNLVSPAAAGTYQGFFKLRASDSSTFGIGTDANTAFWVKIKVSAIVLPPPAIAPTTTQVFSQVSIAAGNVGHATVACPAGSVVVGGGFAAGNSMVVYTHSMEGNGWGAYAKNYSGSAQLLNTYAICLSGTSGTTQQIFKQITVAAGGVGYDTAACPGGSVVTGGGFASSADVLWVYNTSMNGNGWSAYARNTSGTGQLFNIYGICLSGAGGSTSSVLKQVTIAGGSNGSGEALCPAGTLVTGGGYALGTGLVVYNSSMSLDRTKWDAYARNTSGSGQLMNIYAICWTLP
jgi:hypothetical protein